MPERRSAAAHNGVRSSGVATARPAALRRIAAELYAPEQVLEVIRARRHARPDLEHTFVAPRTPTEEKLAQIWAELLGLQQVGIHHNFFDLGGHSLLATQLISRVRAVFQVEVPLSVLFTTRPTVVEFARAIEQHQIERASAAEIADALRELEALSDEEIQALLAGES